MFIHAKTHRDASILNPKPSSNNHHAPPPSPPHKCLVCNAILPQHLLVHGSDVALSLGYSQLGRCSTLSFFPAPLIALCFGFGAFFSDAAVELTCSAFSFYQVSSGATAAAAGCMPNIVTANPCDSLAARWSRFSSSSAAVLHH